MAAAVHCERSLGVPLPSLDLIAFTPFQPLLRDFKHCPSFSPSYKPNPSFRPQPIPYWHALVSALDVTSALYFGIQLAVKPCHYSFSHPSYLSL